MSRPDPAALGTSGFARNANDHYVTPDRTVASLISVMEDDIPELPVWEPFCGDGAFTKQLEPLARDIVSTDIEKYGNFEPDALLDFFTIKPKKLVTAMQEAGQDISGVKTLDDITALKGFQPDAIITNPPYDEAERCLRHALALMEEVQGDVVFLLRHEYDCAKSRNDLFQHPAFFRKITLLHRPRWIAGSTGAPRHNYAYFWWNWSKAAAAPNVKPELLYAK